MNVDEVVEAGKQPFNEILTHIQFSLHALAEDLRQTKSTAYRTTFSLRIKRLKTKRPPLYSEPASQNIIYFAGLSQLSKFSTAHKPYTLRPFFFFSFSFFSCKCTIELHFSGIFMAEIGVTTQHTRTKPKRITISDL